MEKKFVSVVSYLHNDADRIVKFLDTVVQTVKENFEQYELVLVDDACEDSTIELVREYTLKECPNAMVSVVHMGFYQGIESSMNSGRDVAIGDFVYEFDDVSIDYDGSLLMSVYEKLIGGCDIVSARSTAKQRLTSKVFYDLYNRSSNGHSKIGPESFRLVSRRAINRIKSLGKYIPYRKAVYANCGLTASFVSYDPIGNQTKAKKSARERGNLALDSFIYFTNILEKASAVISALFLAFSLGIIIYAIIDRMTGQGVANGWASTMIFMSMGFFGVFALLTIVLKYLSVILNLLFKQHKYMVADIEKIK